MSSQSTPANNSEEVSRFHCTTAGQTVEQARLLASCCPAGLVITLDGTLGAGKTFFTRAFATGLGVPAEDVTSPTYVLIQHYQGTVRSIHHFDLYRLRDLDEWDELGAEELLESEGICLVEWANRFPEVLPEDRLAIQIESTGETSREFTLAASGPASQDVLNCWSEKTKQIRAE